jgi:hypothetical protein
MSAESGVPGDGLILAAIDRAERHRQLPGKGVPRWEVLAHLAIGTRTHAARTVTRRLDALTEDGLLERLKRHGILFWLLTGRGRRQMLKANAAGELPESPQHRRWRETHDAAPGQLEQGRHALETALSETSALLKADAVASSDQWLLAAVRLYAACRLLAAATHCQYEWQEPDDSHADTDTRTATAEALNASPEELRAIRALRSERRKLPHDK